MREPYRVVFEYIGKVQAFSGSRYSIEFINKKDFDN